MLTVQQMSMTSFHEPPGEGTGPTTCRPGPPTRRFRFMVPMRAKKGVGAFPEPLSVNPVGTDSTSSLTFLGLPEEISGTRWNASLPLGEPL